MRMTINGIEPESMTFPDGQPHVKLNAIPEASRYDIQCSIRNSEELMRLMLVANVLGKRNSGEHLYLEIAYLLGARMDRPIDHYQPFTLEVVTKIINTFQFAGILLFNVHSEVSENLLRAVNILPIKQIKEIKRFYNEMGIHLACVAPDKGSVNWIKYCVDHYVTCTKIRDSQTGKLSAFKVDQPNEVNSRECLIIDDICDGGGTFVGLAKELRKAGAKKILLYVSHGIFSKGFELEGIDEIWTTDSYWKREHYPENIHVLSAL
jgi:ribose-phosphate pyrophosphokinase